MTPLRRHLNGAGFSVLLHGGMAGSILWFWHQQPIKPPPEPVRWEISLFTAPPPPAPVQEPQKITQPVVAPPPNPQPKPKPKLKPVHRLVPKPVTHNLAAEPPKEAPEPQPPAPVSAPVSNVSPKAPIGPATKAAAKPDQPDFGWLRSYLAAKIRQHRHYPSAAKAQGWEGRVLVRMIIGSSGDLLSAEILKSSGHEILDQEAVATVRRVTPVPVSTAHHWTQVAITVPFDYRLER